MKRAAASTEPVTTNPAVTSADLALVDGGVSLGFSFGLKLGGSRRPAVVAAPPIVYQPAPVLYPTPVVAAPVYGVVYC